MKAKEKLAQELGQRVKAVRLHLDMKQKDFAESLDISAPTLSDVENGNFKPSIELLMGLSEKYRVNLNYILFGDDEMFVSQVLEKWSRAGQFGVNVEAVQDFLFHFEHSNIVQYRVLAMFRDMMNREKESITSDLKKSLDE